MKDRYRREINYLRISVTDRCNLRCVYCMPPEGISFLSHDEVLTFEEIYRLASAAAMMGIRKLRLTGGEPLVRLGLTELVRMLSAVAGIEDLALTTNGVLLAENAASLKLAGLGRVNISLDTLDPYRYSRITRGGDLRLVWQGIEAALDQGLQPVKINTVVLRGFNDDEISALARLSVDRPLHMRFIELMPVGPSNDRMAERCIPTGEVKDLIVRQLGPLEEVRSPFGNGPARYYQLEGALGTIGLISAISDHFCARCNRLRLTASGGLRACLFAQREIDVKSALRAGASQKELADLIKLVIRTKPDRHHLTAGWNHGSKTMSQIGG